MFEDNIPTTRIKVITLGEQRTGKSTLIKKYCEKRFEQNYIPTIVIDYGVKTDQVQSNNKNVNIRVDFFDCSGDPEYLQVRNEFYSGLDGILLVYDVTKRESFEELDKWLLELQKYGFSSSNVNILLCANKTDCMNRQVSTELGQDFATLNGLEYFELNARSDTSDVYEMFQSLFRSIILKTSLRK